jgi:cell division protein FtsB
VLEQRVTDLAAEEERLETRADRLRPGETLDRDYLEERVRITLAAGDREEIVFAVE